MATTIRIYNQADNRYYTVTVDCFANVLDNNGTDMDVDYYVKITTTMRRKTDNTAFPQYVIRYLTDVPAVYPVPTNFTELIDDYIDYFVNQAELGMSSSSSESSSTSSSSRSSASSSSRSSASSLSSVSSESSPSSESSESSSSISSESSESSSSISSESSEGSESP